MLTYPIMGALALAILWSATLLVQVAAVGDVARWWRLRRKLAAPGVVVSGRVAAGVALARRTVTQRGRWGATGEGDGRAILFHDRAYRGELMGGAVEVDGSKLEVRADGA